MSPVLSDRSRQRLSRSLPLVQAHKHDLIDRMQAGLAIADPDQKAGQSEINAMLLVEMLISQVRHMLDTGELDSVAPIAREHSEQHITGRTYSRFGDLLVPILRDVLGANLPIAVPGAWVDAFWTVVRAVTAQPALEPA